MSKFIIGKKMGMSQIFREDGTVVPVTLISVKPNTVIQVKTKEKDGYEAVQVGTGTTRRLKKPQKGHFKNLGSFAHVKEIYSLVHGEKTLAAGDSLDLSAFQPGDKVKVSGVTKGKGFAGAVKRHGFSGMPASHGHKSVKRHIGSIGQRFPQHTLKGKRMAGHMGHENLTVRGLEVVAVDSAAGLLSLKGAVPGNKGGWVRIISL